MKILNRVKQIRKLVKLIKANKENKEIKTTNDIILVRDSHKVGDKITCVVDRKGEDQTLTLTIGDSGDFQSNKPSTEDDDYED